VRSSTRRSRRTGAGPRWTPAWRSNRRQRPGDPPTEESATTLFNGLFFDDRKYDLSQVGRFKFNAKLGLKKPLNRRILDVDDFLHLVKYLLRLHATWGGSTTSTRSPTGGSAPSAS